MMTTPDAAGVDYGNLDLAKVTASQFALRTSGFAAGKGWTELPWTRGESAYAMEHDATGMIIAVTIEGLGTKNLVAEHPDLADLLPQSYVHIAQDNVAMILNDLITIGATPILFMLHPALAEGDHLSGELGNALWKGTFDAMKVCNTVWGPGETPELKGLVFPGTMCLSGAAVGFVGGAQTLINPAKLRAGQRIVLLGSSGIHANGLTRARAIAETLPQGYRTLMGDGQMYGEALLAPTTLYVPFMERCQEDGVPIAYAVNMTGHGWRKIMRAPQPFTYRITKVPQPQTVFRFMQREGRISDADAYKAFNMGAGFCLIVEPHLVPQLKLIGANLNIPVLDAGVVEEGEKQVIIEPLNITLDELSIR